MRILMINVVCGIRSTGRICTDLATVLESKGHDVKIAYGRENVPKQFQKYAVKIGSDFDVKLHGVKARLFDSAGFGSKLSTVRFIKWIEEYDPDIIHLHNLHGYYINVEILFDYLKRSGKKVIWTLHDCWSFTGHTAYCDTVNCMRWREKCYNCPLLKEYPKSFFDHSKRNWNKKKLVFTKVPNMTIITPSKWLASMVKQSFLKEYPVIVINNGIDTKQFYPMKSNFRKRYALENKIIILGVATAWDEMKGYSDFLKLAQLLDDRYKIVLVGLTQTQVEKLPNNIIGIQRTANTRELAEIYTAADVFLNLSYCENYPTVNLESMACGTPVLTYDTGGSPEIIHHNGGIIVEKGDLDAVVNELMQYDQMQSNNSFVSVENDVMKTIEKYLKIY